MGSTSIFLAGRFRKIGVSDEKRLAFSKNVQNLANFHYRP